MERALVIGASGGIGRALVAELAARGSNVTPLSRRDDGLDVTDTASVDDILGRRTGPFQTVIVATGILSPPGKQPEKQLAAIDGHAFAQVLAVNTIGVANVLRHIPRLLPKKGRSVVGVLTARVGSIGDNRIGGWHSYRASKAAANMLVRGAAIELGRTHKEAIIAALHPGTVATPFTSDYSGRHKTVSASIAAANLCNVLGALEPEQSGGFFDYAGNPVTW